MVKVSYLFEDLPVTLNSDEFERLTGINLANELETESEKELQEFLDRVHESLYYNLIYKIGGKSLKDKVIINYIDQLEKPLKMCLVAQINYMLDAGGDYGTVDGSNLTPDGALNITNPEAIKNKIIAPKVYEILRGARPNIILGV